MSVGEDSEIATALTRIQELVDAQRPALNLTPRELDPGKLHRFSSTLLEHLTEADEERLRAEIARLSPWLQGPFYLGGEVVIAGLWRNDQRWEAMQEHVPDLRDKRVLDIGSNAGYDPFMFHTLGAREVLGCEPFEFIAQARFLESLYKTGVQLEQIGWQRLNPEVHGRFDFVHCNGVLYHELNPVSLLQRLRKMVNDDGELWLGSMMLADPELSECARFIRNDYAGDPTWWWVPGRLALRWMLEASGFTAEHLPIEFDGPRGAFEVVNGYLRGRPGLLDAHLDVPEALREIP
jgi:tRNA (mo5U34)-methyltransferase